MFFFLVALTEVMSNRINGKNDKLLKQKEKQTLSIGCCSGSKKLASNSSTVYYDAHESHSDSFHLKHSKEAMNKKSLKTYFTSLSSTQNSSQPNLYNSLKARTKKRLRDSIIPTAMSVPHFLATLALSPFSNCMSIRKKQNKN